MPSVLRRYDDANAPQLGGNVSGSLINVLKHVLVDGYGTQPALGWSLEMEDVGNNVAVFRQGGDGIRPHVQVQDNRSSTTVQTALCTAYESMTDVNTGIGPCPPESAGEWRCLMKCMTNVSSNIPWVIIGDELGFWLLVRPYDYTQTAVNNGSLYIAHYIGDWNCTVAGNNYNFCTILTKSDGSGRFENTTTNYNMYLMRHPTTLELGAYRFYPYWHYSAGYGCIGYASASNNFQSPVNGRYIYYPCMMYLNNDPCWGTIPGMLNQIWNRASGANMNAAEREEFYDVNGNERVFCFALKARSWLYNSRVSRGSIVIGEGFRNAY